MQACIGRLARSWASLGAMDGQLDYTYGIAVSNVTVEVFVADCDNHRILVFTLEGQFVCGLGERDGPFQ